MDELEKFYKEKKENIEKLGKDPKVKQIALEYLIHTNKYKYSYNYTWLGRPIIQHPQDIIAMQEIIWEVKPEIIIETGIAHGGSIIFYASMLELIGRGEVLGIDIDIRDYNRKLIEAHPLYKRINLIEGSSISNDVITKVREFCKGKKKILVCLDSDHTYNHVCKELELYSQFVSFNSYLVVFDTIIEDLPNDSFLNRTWGKGNNPKIAVRNFLRNREDFIIDQSIEDKLVVTTAPGGYLKRIK